VQVGQQYPLFEYPPYDLALAVQMHEVVKAHGIEVLHCHYAIPHATSAWIAREMLRAEHADVAVVTTLHGTDITLVGQDPSFHAITKFSIEKSDRITAVSEYLRDETFNAFHCTGCRVAVIPNFVDPTVYDRSRYGEADRLPFANGKKVLMHISNFRTVKRVRDVVRIFASVAATVPSVLVMVGDGPDRPAAEDEARLLGVLDSVFFLGKIEAVAPLLANADLFLLPTGSESFGLSALEAMASSVPVVGTDTGGLPEVVTNGVTGLLYPIGDVESMAAGALSILTEPGRQATMGAAGAADARARFAIDNIVSQYESLYRSAIHQPSDAH
jgi:N-acetyl-alpha-D-glucosaminyl L-malate synthase BshA